MMNDILQDFISHGELICYMDDILIHSEDLTTLHCHQLFLKPEKCKFDWKEIDYLGLVISHGHIGMDPVRVQGVTEWLVPRRLKEVQSFLGFVNFYQRFIKGYSDIARPLHALTQKSQTWSWGLTHQHAFETLKTAITSAPVLTFPSDHGKSCLQCDASNFTTGAVLSQHQDDGTLHPIAFMSKAFSEVEQNYQVHDKEMLAII